MNEGEKEYKNNCIEIYRNNKRIEKEKQKTKNKTKLMFYRIKTIVQSSTVQFSERSFRAFEQIRGIKIAFELHRKYSKNKRFEKQKSTRTRREYHFQRCLSM